MVKNNLPENTTSISIKYLLPPILIIPMFVISLLVISGLVYILYQDVYGCVYEERMSLLRTVQDLAPETSSQKLSSDNLNKLAETPYMQFVRLVDIKNNNIILSAGPDQELSPNDKLPVFSDEPASSSIIRNNASIVEMNIKLNDNQGLWFGFNMDTVKMHFVESVGFAIMLVIIIDIFFYIFAFSFFKKIFLNPFNEILAIIEKLGKGDYSVKISAKTNILLEIDELINSLDKMKEGFSSNQKRSEAISKLKSEFISVVAHQLRTPLSAIKWAMGIMIKGDFGQVNADQKDLLEKSNESNNRMISLVSDLLNVTKMEEGRFGFDFVISDIGEVIKKSIVDSSLISEKMKVEAIFSEPKQKLPQVRLDNEKIKIAIDNIIGNALKYSRPNGQVVISAKPYKNKYIEVIIKDNGIGIPKNNLNSLFTKFFRADNAVKKQTEGSGLGLFIAKNIIVNHGGEIWAESEENVGSTFYFTIPTDVDLLPKKEIKFEDFFQSL